MDNTELTTIIDSLGLLVTEMLAYLAHNSRDGHEMLDTLLERAQSRDESFPDLTHAKRVIEDARSMLPPSGA